MNPSAKQIVIVGSGFGGLAEAIRLQARGFQVTLVEKREKVGGRAYQFQKQGYTFDMGPSLITAPFLIEKLFELAGKRMSDYLDLILLDPFYRVYFHDGAVIDYVRDPEQMKVQMARLSPRDAARYDDFFADIKGIYDAIITDGLGAQPFLTWGSMLKFVPRAVSLGALRSVYSFVARYFKHEHHRFLFSFQPLFIGGSPFSVPSIYLMIPYLEREGGCWYARGGMYQVVKALARLFEELGGTIRTGFGVEEVLVERGRAVGVRSNGTEMKADAVVCNADVSQVYRHLIRPEWRRRWKDRALDRLRMTMSCFLLYLGTRKRFLALKHHTLIVGSLYRELVRDIIDRRVMPKDFSMYLHTPTRTDDSMAPPGCECLYVLVPVPNLTSGIDWNREAEPFAQRILDRLEHSFGLRGLKQSIEVMEWFTPLNFEADLSSHQGNAFGIEPILRQSAYFRPHNRSEDVERLYFVGAGTHPGGGVPGVILSAEATEGCILEDLGEHG